jgi:peptidoglycan/xylan/chitin deacetylase (PgdA/CDA1 family)
MRRRDLFKTVAAAGAVAATARRGHAQMVEGGGPAGKWPEWPFEEIRIPYRERFGRIRWPNNGPLCVHVYVTAEWGSTPPENAGRDVKFRRDLSVESEQGEYAFTVGIWRAVRMLDKFDIKATIFPHSRMVARYPDLFRELAGKGHEIVARSNVGTPTMTPDEERAAIREATSIVEKAVGQRPVGWINPGAKCTDQTPQFLADEGYMWHGDLKGDDLPYGLLLKNGKRIVEIPHRTAAANDFAWFPEGGGLKGLRSGREGLEFIKDMFDEYYALGKEEYPGAMTFGIHPQRSCMPERVRVVERGLDYMRTFSDVWFARYVDMAEHWMKHYMDVRS